MLYLKSDKSDDLYFKSEKKYFKSEKKYFKLHSKLTPILGTKGCGYVRYPGHLPPRSHVPNSETVATATSQHSVLIGSPQNATATAMDQSKTWNFASYKFQPRG